MRPLAVPSSNLGFTRPPPPRGAAAIMPWLESAPLPPCYAVWIARSCQSHHARVNDDENEIHGTEGAIDKNAGTVLDPTLFSLDWIYSCQQKRERQPQGTEEGGEYEGSHSQGKSWSV